MMHQPKLKTTGSSDTLQRHREMYERRLRLLRRTEGQSTRELADTANDPSVFRKEAANDDDPNETEDAPAACK
ncbi:MAG: hypothetical protein ACHP7I_01280 [Terriglobales bacterium]